MRSVVLLAVLMLATGQRALAGPLSKFERRPPVSSFETSNKMEDVERCLLDVSGLGLPYVYKQGDRPNDVTMMWNPNMDINSIRVDLHRTERGTRVTNWGPLKLVSECAPT